MEDGFFPTVKYKKSFLGDDFEKFEGFLPFGFTLIQPSHEWFTSRYVYCAHRWPRELGVLRREILSLRIYTLNFQSVRIYNDAIVRDILWERSFCPKVLAKGNSKRL